MGVPLSDLNRASPGLCTWLTGPVGAEAGGPDVESRARATTFVAGDRILIYVIRQAVQSEILLFTGIPICGIDPSSPCRHEGRCASSRNVARPLAASGDSVIPEKWVTGFPIRIMLK